MKTLTPSQPKTHRTNKLGQQQWTRLCRYIQANPGIDPEQAQDLTQEIFYRLLKSDALTRLLESDANEAQLLSYFKTTAKRVIIDHYRHGQTQRRKGWTDREPFDENQHAGETNRGSNYEDLERIAARGERLLAEEFRRRGNAGLFDALRDSLVPGSPGIDYSSMAKRSGKSVANFRVTLFRARRRYRDLVREQLALSLQGISSTTPGHTSTAATLCAR